MTLWRIADDAAWVDSAPDRIVVMNLATGEQPQALLGTAAAVWRRLLGPDPEHPRVSVREDAVIVRLAEEYRAAAEAIARDVTALLNRLSEDGLVDSDSAS